MLVFNQRLIEATRRLPVVTASLNADRYLLDAGSHRLALYDPHSRSRLPIGEFRVLQARRPVELPPPPLRWPAVAAPIELPLIIAHAGGGLDGRRYLNSIEALDHNYALGHRVFELDFAWTSDRQLVAIHDWLASWQMLFPEADHLAPSDYPEFLAARMLADQTQIDLLRLRVWLREHPDAWIVTDIHGEPLAGLQHLKAKLGPRQKQLIPQMYHAHRYADIRALGYEQIIFTLYASSLDTDSLLEFIRGTPLFAVTLNPSRPDAERLIAELSREKIPVYVHTFNALEDFASFRARGVHGLYSDFLYLDKEGRIERQ